jgi:transposase
MMGRQTVDQSQLFYLFNLEEHIPADHLLRRLNPIVTRVLDDVREKLAPFYSDIGRPSIDPELMIRMLIVGYCYGIRFERKLCEEVKLHLGYRWFCRLELDDKVPDHSAFSVNRHGRFRDSDIFRQMSGCQPGARFGGICGRRLGRHDGRRKAGGLAIGAERARAPPR